MASRCWRSACAVSGLLLFAAATTATSAERLETIAFAPGATSATLNGAIRGSDAVRYAVGAASGQVMSVMFSPFHRSCYMNVWVPGADSADFNGAVSGNEYGARLTVSGTYAIQVYLMRNAARRHETCRYRLTIEIAGPSGVTNLGGADSRLQDRCRSEAAAMYDVAPGRIDAGEVRTVPTGGYDIDATADKGAEGVKKLRCIFTATRGFDRIMAMTPDGER